MKEIGQMADIELKPCPFCGMPPVHRAAMGEHWFFCNHCGASTAMQGRPDLAIEAWNRRTERAPGEVTPDGWKLVPIDPTPDMERAGEVAATMWYEAEATGTETGTPHDATYRAMVEAAPSPPLQRSRPSEHDQGMAAAPLPPLEGGARMTTDADEIAARVLEEVADGLERNKGSRHPEFYVMSAAAHFRSRAQSLRDPKALRERSSPAAPLPAGPGLELYTQGYDDMWQATIYKRIHEAEAVIRAARDLIDDPALGSVAGWYDSVTHLRHFLSALDARLAKQGGW